MGLADSAKVYLQASRFLVSMDGMDSQEFSEVSGLEMTFEEFKYRHGGSRVPYKAPGNVEFSDITLKRAVVAKDVDFYLWAASQAQMTAAGVGAKAIGIGNDAAKRNGEITALDNDGTELTRWGLNGAFVKSFKPGDFKADSNDPVMEELVLSIQFFDRVG